MPAYTTLRTTHYIEGQDPLALGAVGPPSIVNITGTLGVLGQVPGNRFTAILREGRERGERTAKAKARAKIKPIADPEEGKAKRRKAAARRRRGGRLGTMLTQRETLG